MKGAWKTGQCTWLWASIWNGQKDVLGLWTSATEGAKFWMNVLTELRNRGVRDIYLVCVDGLKGFPQAIEAIFPKAQVQLCIVHLVRASMKYVTWKDLQAGDGGSEADLPRRHRG